MGSSTGARAAQDGNGERGRGEADEPQNASLETVGGVYNRYRLVHWRVPETVLHVQSLLE